MVLLAGVLECSSVNRTTLLTKAQKTETKQEITYISTEHPAITYYNKKYIEYINLTARRYGRHDRFYYVDLHVHMLYTMDNQFKMDFFFFEYLSNTYRRSFVEMHMRFCDLVLKDKFFGPPIRRALKTCPLPRGKYSLPNCSIPVESIPAGFPFKKGRIYLNITYASAKELELVASGYINMEIKEYNDAKKKT